MITDFELGWLVGILEGEGHFRFNCSQVIAFKMNDEDVIEKVASLFGKIVGKCFNIRLIERPNPNHANSYEVCANGESARIIMRLIAPHMHYRRRKKIWQALNKYKPKNIPIPLIPLSDLISMQEAAE